jgi:hypothetical protein
VCWKGVRCDAGSFNGRTRVFEARHERSIRSPAARFALNGSSRSGEGYGYFSFQENTVTDCSLLLVERKVSAVVRELSRGAKRFTAAPLNKRCEVIQWLGSPALTRFMHVRIVPSQPNLNVVAESSGRMPDCLSGGTGSTPVATANVC